MYDWANSVYSLVITTAIFPTYYNSITSAKNGSDIVDFFGFKVINSVLYSYSLSCSFLIVALILPLLSGIADYSGRKKLFMKIFAYTGAVSCALLYFFDGTNVELAIIASVMASIGYSASLVFYDAFLPEITTLDRFDNISARGYSLGYIGSVILLIVNLVMIIKYETFGFESEAAATRLSFLMVGLWWIGFSQITFARLKDNVFNRKVTGSVLTEGYKELQKVWGSLKQMRVMKLFLLAFFFYNTGVQTIMYLATLFGSKELKLETDELIMVMLIIQLVAIGGAYLFAYLSKLKGNKLSLQVMVIIWIVVCFSAYFVYSANEFYALAFVVGLVMGGIQSLSRATFAKLIPENSIDHASYFSFYDVTYNISIVVGTFTYGLINQITGSMRDSALALMLFFIVGLGFLILTKVPLKSAFRRA